MHNHHHLHTRPVEREPKKCHVGFQNKQINMNINFGIPHQMPEYLFVPLEKIKDIVGPLPSHYIKLVRC